MDGKGYITKNLQLASFIYASGLQFVNTRTVNGEIFFEFTPKDRAELLVKNYFTNSAQINPKELFARLNDLKDLIFSQQ